MGTATRYPEFRDVTERLAREFGLGMSGYFGEIGHDPQYREWLAHSLDCLVAMDGSLHPRFNLLFTHDGIDDAELGALLDMNTSGPLAEMSKNRQGELTALTSSRFREALEARNVKLVTYRDVIGKLGLEAMTRPGA